MAWVVQSNGSDDQMESATLGNLLSSKVRVLSTGVTWANTGYLWSQASTGSSTREMGLYLQSATQLRARLGGFDFILTSEAPTMDNSTVDFTVDFINGTILLIIDGNTITDGTVTLGSSRVDGVLFRAFARQGGFLAPIGTRIGNTAVYIDDVLVRNYNFDGSYHGSGSVTVSETVSSNNWSGVNMPTDGSAWIDLGGSSGITLTGTSIPTQTEADIVTGGKTIILTLTGDTFVTGLSSLNGIAGGSDSDITASGTNWDSLIKADLDNNNVVLSVGDTVATITLPAYASYDIPATETITWTIPSASLTTGTSDIIATPTHTVTAVVSGVPIPVIMGSYRQRRH